MKIPTILSILLLGTASLQADVPSALSYQGRVLQNGQPFEGTGHFVFGIYEGSTLLWTNKLPVPSPLNDPASGIDSSDAKALTVRNGVFTVRLGEGDANNAPVGTDVFFKFDGTQRVRTDVKMAVWFSPAAEGPYTRLDPDITFTSVPFAQVAGVAEMVKDGQVTSTSLADNAVTIDKIADGAIAQAKIADGAISEAKISANAITAPIVKDGEIGLAKLTESVAEALTPIGEVISYAGTVNDTNGVVEPIPGYLLCNGAVIDATVSDGKYAALRDVILNSWGNGGDANDPDLVNLPDLRGVFLRGWNGLAVDGYSDPDRGDAQRPARKSGGNVGNRVGAFQLDQLKSHDHSLPYKQVPRPGGGSEPTPYPGSDHRTGSTGGSETRGKNAYVVYLIKY